MINYYLFIPLFIILILIIPIPILFKTSLNILDPKAIVVVYIARKKVKGLVIKGDFHGIRVYEDRREIPNNNQEQQESVYFEKLFIQVKDKLRLKCINVNYNIGVGDAFLSSLIGGWLNTFLYIIFSKIKYEKPTASLTISDNISYNANVFEFVFIMKSYLSLFDLVYSLLYSGILTIKEKINKKCVV